MPRLPLKEGSSAERRLRYVGRMVLASVSCSLRGLPPDLSLLRLLGWTTPVQAAMPSSRAAVPPRIAIRSSSLNPGVLSTRSTSVLVHGNG
jgi:hypothetical protein